MSIVEVIYKSIGVAVAYLDKPSPFLQSSRLLVLITYLNVSYIILSPYTNLTQVTLYSCGSSFSTQYAYNIACQNFSSYQTDSGSTDHVYFRIMNQASLYLYSIQAKNLPIFVVVIIFYSINSNNYYYCPCNILSVSHKFMAVWCFCPYSIDMHLITQG